MKKPFIIGIIGCLIILLQNCYYDNQEELYPSLAACDTAHVTFTSTIKPILNDYCISCHSNSNPSGGIKLQDYSDVSLNADQALQAIQHKGSIPPMPQGSKLDDCLITQFGIWVKNGKKND